MSIRLNMEMNMDLESLSQKTLADLREIARLAGVKSVTTYRKEQLIRKLVSLHNEASVPDSEMPDSEAPAENAPLPQEEEETQTSPQEGHRQKKKKGEKNSESVKGQGGPDAEGILEIHPEGYGFLRNEVKMFMFP